MYERHVNFSDLIGKTLSAVRNIDDEVLVFETADGKTFKLLHEQDCCERVSIESITGDLSDLVGHPILIAEEATSNAHPEGYVAPEYEESYTWTFYKLATIKGYVDVRWFGESNGYYSESVHFVEAA